MVCVWLDTLQDSNIRCSRSLRDVRDLHGLNCGEARPVNFAAGTCLAFLQASSKDREARAKEQKAVGEPARMHKTREAESTSEVEKRTSPKWRKVVAGIHMACSCLVIQSRSLIFVYILPVSCVDMTQAKTALRDESADTCNDSHLEVWDCFLFDILPAIQYNANREHAFIMRASRMFPNHMNHDPWKNGPIAVDSQDPAHMQLLNSALHSRIFEPATPKGPSRRRSHDNESEGSRLHDMDPIQDPVTTLTHSAVTLSAPPFITYQRTSTHTSFLYLSPHTTYQVTFDLASHRKIAAAQGSTNTPAEWSLMQSI